MINQIKVELYKLQKNQTFWVLLFISIGLSALMHFLVIADWWQMYGTTFNQVGLHELNGLSPFAIPLFFNLFISTLAGFFIAIEFSHGSVIKNQIISGSHRKHIYLSKYIVFSIGSIIITILSPLLTGLIETVLFGYGDILTSASLLYLGRVYGLFALQLLGYTAIILLLAMVSEDSGKTIIFSILFTIVLFAVEKLPHLPLLSTVYKFSIFHQFSNVFKLPMAIDEMLIAILIALLTIVVVTFCGIAIFNKKEIK